MPFIENQAEFTARQGCSFLHDGPLVRFENGATWNEENKRGCDPPDDAVGVLQERAKYWKILLRRTKNKARQCGEYIRTSAEYLRLGAGPGPDPESYEELKQFTTEIKRIETIVWSLEVDIDETKGPSPMQQYQAQRAEDAALAEDAMQKLHSVLNGR